MIYVIQLGQEVCINKTDNFDTIKNHCKYYGLELVGLLFGFLIISTAEPIAFVAQILRAIRLRRIIDAQQSYFNERTRPTELIARFQEPRLKKILAICIGIVSVIYVGAGLVLFFSDHLYWMPSFDASSYSFYTQSLDFNTIQHNFEVGV